MAVQIVMAARVAEIKIVRGAECTRLIRKFQCFVASAPLRRAAPPPQSTTPPSSSLLSASVRPSVQVQPECLTPTWVRVLVFIVVSSIFLP